MKTEQSNRSLAQVCKVLLTSTLACLSPQSAHASRPSRSRGVLSLHDADLFEPSRHAFALQHAHYLHQGSKPICIVDLHMPNEQVYAELSVANHHDYAQCHDLRYISADAHVSREHFRDPSKESDSAQGAGLYWQKLTALAAVSSMREPSGNLTCEWMMWTDTDAVFTNFNKSVTTVIEQYTNLPGVPRDVLFSREETTFPTSFVNVGVFFVRNSRWGLAMLQGAADLFPKHKGWGQPEQNAIMEYAFGIDPRRRNMDERESVEAHCRPEIAIVPQRDFNSFVWRNDKLFSGATEGSEWQPGDLVAHIASRGREGRAELIKRVTQDAACPSG